MNVKCVFASNALKGILIYMHDVHVKLFVDLVIVFFSLSSFVGLMCVYVCYIIWLNDWLLLFPCSSFPCYFCVWFDTFCFPVCVYILACCYRTYFRIPSHSFGSSFIFSVTVPLISQAAVSMYLWMICMGIWYFTLIHAPFFFPTIYILQFWYICIHLYIYGSTIKHGHNDRFQMKEEIRIYGYAHTFYPHTHLTSFETSMHFA